MNSNEIILGKAKKSIKIAGIACVVVIFILMLLVSISSFGDASDEELIGMIAMDVVTLAIMVVGIVLLFKLPTDMIVYNKVTGEFKVRQGQSMKDTKTPVSFNLDDIESVTYKSGSKSNYMVVTVTRHEYIKFTLKNGAEYYVFGTSDAEGVAKRIYRMVNDKEDN